MSASASQVPMLHDPHAHALTKEAKEPVPLACRQIKNGMFPVRVNEHVLMLNWNQHSIPMLRQYAAARTQGVDPFFNR